MSNQLQIDDSHLSFDLGSLNKSGNDNSDRNHEKVKLIQTQTNILFKCLERVDGWKKSGPGSNLLMRLDVNDDDDDDSDDMSDNNNSIDINDNNSDDDKSEDDKDDEIHGLKEGIDYVRLDWYACLPTDAQGYEVIEQHYNKLYTDYVSGTNVGKRYIELCLLGNEDVDTVYIPNYESAATALISNLMSSLSVGAPHQYSPSLRRNQDAVTTLQIMLSTMELKVKEEQELMKQLDLERQKRMRQQELEEEKRKKQLELEQEKKKQQELQEKTLQLEIELATTTLVQNDSKKRRLGMLLPSNGIISTDMDQDMDTEGRPNKRPATCQLATSSQTLDSDNNDTSSLPPDGSEFNIDDDTLMEIQPTETGVEEVTSIPTPPPSSAAITTASQQVQSPSRRAILQNMVVSVTTSEQARLLKQVDLPSIQKFEAIAFELIDSKLIRMEFEELPDDVNIESVPLFPTSRSQCSESKSPLLLGFTRGSTGTNSTTTTQVVHSLTAGMVGVNCNVLPKDTEVCTIIVGGLETSRHKTKEAVAIINLRKILHRVDKDRQVIIAVSESLRFGLLQEVVEDILLEMNTIHPHVKVLFVKEGGLHPSDTSSIHQDYSEGYQRITLECGGQKNPRDKSVQVSGDAQDEQDENDMKAAELKKHLLHLRNTNKPLPDQLLKGAERGRDSQHDLGPRMAELVDVKDDLECHLFDGNALSNETVMKMFEPYIDKEDGSIIKMPGFLQRCSSSKSYEETEKVGGIVAQQYSKNYVLGKEKGLINETTPLFITNAIRGRGASGFVVDGHDDLVKLGALITKRRLSVLLSTTTIRGGLDEIELMILDNLCTMTGIDWDLSEEIGRDNADVIAAGTERQQQLDIRLETKNLAMKELVDKLSDEDKSWNRVMSMIGSRRLKPEQHRFKDVLKEAIEKRRLGRRTLDCLWQHAKEDPSKLNDDDAIRIVNSYCFKRMWCSTLKSSSLSVLTDVHSWAMNQSPISSPDEAKTIIQTVMSKRTVLESEQLHASKEFQQQWLDNYEREKKERLDNYESFSQATEVEKNKLEQEETEKAARLLEQIQVRIAERKQATETEKNKLAMARAATSYQLNQSLTDSSQWTSLNKYETSANKTMPSLKPVEATVRRKISWDDMFQYLVRFIEDTRAEKTKNMTEEKKSAWVWDGNVPTNYKTPCGQALGRWINNQRSAKAKGTLKDDREVRLVSTGLKWSVLTTSSWKQMLDELESYANSQTKNGRAWDGNVPTNHKVRVKSAASAGGTDHDEEKNLGRWVNRQRTLYQSGKLKKERQDDLERIGLRLGMKEKGKKEEREREEDS